MHDDISAYLEWAQTAALQELYETTIDQRSHQDAISYEPGATRLVRQDRLFSQ